MLCFTPYSFSAALYEALVYWLPRSEWSTAPQNSGYAAAVFLLSADEILWEKVRKNVLDTGIYFDRVRLGGVTLEQYILFHAAKDVYSGTKHIRLSELTDRELIPDEILRLIVNAFVIEKCGVEIVKQEVWNAD